MTIDKEYLECACWSKEHTVCFEYDPEYGEVSVHVQMFEWRGFWKRLVEAVKFVFRPRRSTGWDYCILRREDYPKLLAMLKASEDHNGAQAS